ncbi:hypothetical protein [Kitasatospora sp. NPDC002040]|uniref:bestrophin-like domain n=1 Tax=Kitasatospora sp. NPDC002040 TaxID=3154661 RepID=UPI003316EC2B
MGLSGLFIPLAAAAAAALLAWLSHVLLHRHTLPDTGPAVGTAAGAVLSFFVVTMAFLLVNSTGALTTARQNNYAEAAAAVDLYLAAQQLPEPARHQLRGHTEEYLHQVIEVEWPQMAAERIDPATFAPAYHMRQIIQNLPVDVPVRASDDAHDAMVGLLTQRRIRMAAANDGAPTFLLVTLAGAAVLSVLFLVLLGWPRGRRGIIAIGVVGGVLAFSIWLVLQIDHPYGSGIRVEPAAFDEALVRISAIRSAGY